MYILIAQRKWESQGHLQVLPPFLYSKCPRRCRLHLHVVQGTELGPGWPWKYRGGVLGWEWAIFHDEEEAACEVTCQAFEDLQGNWQLKHPLGLELHLGCSF